MPGHDRSAPARRRPRSRRERAVLAVGALLSAALVALVAFSLTTHQAKSRHGCIDFDYITMLGGAEMHQCGGRARTLCAEPATRHDPDPGFRRDLVVACRKAGIPVG